jgi:hypothetical protein
MLSRKPVSGSERGLDRKNCYILVRLGIDMWRRKTLILWIAFSIGSVPGTAESFTIHPAATAGHIEVRYFLTGAFGGYGSLVHDPGEDGAYRIPLEHEGKPAITLKAILYARGCQFIILSVALMANPTRSATFECNQLSTTTLRGRISPPASNTGDLDVEVRYLSLWGHRLFGIADGAIQSFSLGKTPLDGGSRFQIQIPDFSKDLVTTQMQDAFLKVLIVEHSTWNIVERLLPSADLQYRKTGLRILPWYDSEVHFIGNP